MRHTHLQIKYKIQQQFSNAVKDYDNKAVLQKKVAEELLDFILRITHHTYASRILDIGCGTGFLTISLAKTFPYAKVFACDIAHPMVETANLKSQTSNLKSVFTNADCESLPYKERQFDLITSSLTYQWLGHPYAAFLEAYRVLRHNGTFAFSMLGSRTFKELRQCYKETNLVFNKDGLPPFRQFCNSDNIISKLKEIGFKDVSAAMDLKLEQFEDMMEFLKLLKSIGAGNPSDTADKSLGSGAALKKMSQIYKERFSIKDSIYATYEVLFFSARK